MTIWRETESNLEAPSLELSSHRKAPTMYRIHTHERSPMRSLDSSLSHAISQPNAPDPPKTRVSHPSPPSQHQHPNHTHQPKPPHPPPPSSRTTRPSRSLHTRRIARRKHHRHARIPRRPHRLGGQQRVVEGVARRPVRARRDAVGDRDGQVEDGVVVLAVEAEGLAD